MAPRPDHSRSVESLIRSQPSNPLPPVPIATTPPAIPNYSHPPLKRNGSRLQFHFTFGESASADF